MSRAARFQKMRELASKICAELMKEKYAIGAFLFGSMASGDIHEESDIDLAVVYNAVAADIRVGKDERLVDGVRLEVWRYPVVPFVNTFEDEKLRDKSDTWMWTPLWIECMQNGIVLADPTERLADWKAKANQWKWRQGEINGAVKQTRDNVNAAQRHLTNGNPFYSLICLREALTCLSAAHIMKNGLIPSFRPKDLSQKLSIIKDKERELSAVFELVNDVSGLDYNSVEGLLVKLREFLDAEWGAKRIGPRSEYENARSCLLKRNLVGALLSTRYSAYWLGFHIINKREPRTEAKIKAEICNGENHVNMIGKLANASDAFSGFYKQLHFAQKWNTPEMDAAINQTRAVLDDWSKD